VAVGVSLMNSIAASVWIPLLHLLRVREEQQANASPIPQSDSQSNTAADPVFCALFFSFQNDSDAFFFRNIPKV